MSTGLEQYTYLGLGTVVQRTPVKPGIRLTYIKLTGESNGDAGDKYAGLDRFGRVVDQRWITDGDSDVDRYQYSYDRNSNRLTRSNVLDGNFDEVYTYDDLNQIAEYKRAGGSLTSQNWTYDAIGNWSEFESGGVMQTRTHNRLNEITSISGATTPVYDANGNMTTDETNKRCDYDAWNMCGNVKNSSNAVIATYVYDALSRRISVDEASTLTDLYYSAAWQVLEEQVGGTVSTQYFLSPVYIDAMVVRYRFVGGVFDEALYVTQDANFNVTALVDTNGAGNVLERYAYTPFGVVSYYDPNWTNSGNSAFDRVYLYQGGRLDAVTGLYNFRFRDYSPALGRWMIIDPIGYDAGSSNIHENIGNNPIVNYDPYSLSLPGVNPNDALCQRCIRERQPGGWRDEPLPIDCCGTNATYYNLNGRWVLSINDASNSGWRFTYSNSVHK